MSLSTLEPERRNHYADVATLHGAWPVLLLIAVALTLLNALKPLAMDDAAYFAYARQIAHHPLDPYGFQIFWTQWPESANWMLPPPVLPYWWAIAIRWFGPSVFVWKLWLLPWIGLFVFSVHALLRKFSPRVALPLTLFVVFAPVFLPAISYMLDVPALGLGIAGLCVAMRAIDRRSIGLAMLSGLMLGLAMQTKYTAFTLPAVAAIYGFTRRRWIISLVPGIVASVVFIGWELFIAHLYGQSHFLMALRGTDYFNGHDSRLSVLGSCITLMGELGGPLALLMMFAMAMPKRWLVGGAIVVVGSFACITIVPVGMGISIVLGTAIWLVCGVTLWMIARPNAPAHNRRDDLFLLAWFVIEAVACEAISPFGAARRLMGVILVLTLLTARLLDRRNLSAVQRQTLGRVVGFGAAVGLLFFAVDWIDAHAMAAAANAASVYISGRQTQGERVYYKGHWGFQFYCERDGMLPLVPDHTQLRPGDWVVYPTVPINIQSAVLPVADVVAMTSIVMDDPIPLETEPAFYGRYVALDHRTGLRFALTVYQVTAPCIPRTNLSDTQILYWALTRKQPLPPLSIRALLRAMHHANHAVQAKAAHAIEKSGPDALIAALHDSDPRARRWAAVELGKLRLSPKVSHALMMAEHDPTADVRRAANAALAGRSSHAGRISSPPAPQ